MSQVQTHATEPQKKMEPARHLEQESARQPEQRQVQQVAPQAAYRRVQGNGGGVRAADLLALQRAVGNRQVQRIMEGGSTKASSLNNSAAFSESIPDVQRAFEEKGKPEQSAQLSEEQRTKIASIIKTFTTVGPNQLQTMKNDVEEIRQILLEYYISDRDEKKILAKFKFWDNGDQDRNRELQKLIDSHALPEWPPAVSKTLYLDKFIEECWRRTFSKGTFRTAGVEQFTDVFKDLYRELEDENLEHFKNYVQKSKAGRELGSEKVAEFPSFWTEVGLKTVVALPGGITAGVGGALQSLPFEFSEKAGEALKSQAKEYLKTVNYGSEKMIESAVGGSALSGEVAASIAQIGRGGPLALAGKIDQILKIIQGLSKIDEYLALKDKVKLFLEFETYSAQIQSWFTNPEKIIAIVLGLEENKAIDALENWINRSSVTKTSKAVTTSSHGGIAALIGKITRIIDKIRNILRPVFEIRSGIANLMALVETALGEFPFIEDLLKMGQDPQQRATAAFQNLLTQLSKELASGIQRELKEIRQSFKMTVEVFASGDLITEQQVANVITTFALQAIPQKYQSIVAVVKDRPEIKRAISEYLIQPLVPKAALEATNQKIQELGKLVKPTAKEIEAGFDALLKGIDEALKTALESDLKNAFIQRNSEDNHEVEHLPEYPLRQLMTKSSGEAIKDGLRQDMESKLGDDFSQVKLHRDTSAQLASEILHANAFTLGQDIFFAGGKLSSDSRQGRQLLAHELTHVVQQSQGLQQDVIQRDFDKLKARFAKKVGLHAVKGLKFRKARNPKKEERATQARDEVAKLHGKTFSLKDIPPLPKDVYYTILDSVTSEVKKIGRYKDWKHYVPALLVKKNSKQKTYRIELGLLAKISKHKKTAVGKDITDEVKLGRKVKPTKGDWAYAPNWVKWVTKKGGSIQEHSDGSITMLAKSGTCVMYSSDGYPDFRPHLTHPLVNEVKIKGGFHPKRTPDYKKANEAAEENLGKKLGWGDSPPKGYIWHHHEDGETMQLVPEKIHIMFRHSGGVANL